MSQLNAILDDVAWSDKTLAYIAYVEWAKQFSDAILSPDEAGALTISATEMREIVSKVVVRQIAEDPETDSVSSALVLSALADGGYCQAFEPDVESLCEHVWARWQMPAPTISPS